MDKPESNAANLINEYSINSPRELRLIEIANAEGLIVEEEDLKGYLGRISFAGKNGLVKINSKIKEAGQRRFTLAHETGHFFNERNKLSLKYTADSSTAQLPSGGECQKGNEKIYKCTREDIFSYSVNKRQEDDANRFASELLMHRPWFDEFTKKREINFELIKDISEHFDVSLTAAALRYYFIGKYPVAVIMTTNGEVAWSAVSDYFPLKYIPKGYRVRKESAAYDFFKGREMQQVHDLVLSTAWFAEDYNSRSDLYFYEQNTGMKNYNSVLTLLWESEFQ